MNLKKKHLTEGQRYEISAYLQSGKPQKEIVEILGFNRNTISREITLYADGRNGSYKPDLAMRKYKKRMNGKMLTFQEVYGFPETSGGYTTEV